MQRILSLLLFFSVLSFGAQAQVKAAPDANATEEASSPMTFETVVMDYGTIERNADPYRTFTFTNTGDQPIIITNARGSCGCTVPSYSKTPVAPGEGGEVKVRYDTNRVGKFRKRVSLSTNVTSEPIVLTIMGEVVEKPAQPDAVPAGEAGLFNNGQ
jgi:hypothetical protein